MFVITDAADVFVYELLVVRGDFSSLKRVISTPLFNSVSAPFSS